MKKFFRITAAALLTLLVALVQATPPVSAAVTDTQQLYGGGYAATEQLTDVGFSTEIYDSSNGLPTSDSMFLLPDSDGRIWIGGYSGVIVYDSTYFDRLDTSDGLTSARGFFEDSKGRIWTGTNDNGVVVIDGRERTHITYKDGLPSSSIRTFAEDNDGNVFIGTTTGLCYADAELDLHTPGGADLSEERILKFDKDSSGRIYGQTSSGVIFSIEGCKIRETHTSDELGLAKISTIMADPKKAGYVYLGTEDGFCCYGRFGDKNDLQKLSLPELGGSVHWISYDCGRVWISSSSAVGYLDEEMNFHLLDNIPMNSGIEMTVSDYQGNMWFASSTQGVMKLVTNNFVDISKSAGIAGDVANAVYIYENRLYIGTDNGLQIIDESSTPIENELTEFIGNSRIRCIAEDSEGNLRIATYNDESGLVCYTKAGEITNITTSEGLPHNQIRCIEKASDGSLLLGTNGGLAVVSGNKVVRSVGSEDGINNTVFLCVAQGDDDTVMAGTDGDGIYVIGQDSIARLGRDDGLTSDVILKIKRDDKHGVYWIVTSNSVEYMKNGEITHVTTFPYNNNYDIFFDDSDNAWVLSSNGIYTVNAEDMLADTVAEYSFYSIANGLPCAVTANPYCYLDGSGDLYMPGRNGAMKVNINSYYTAQGRVNMDLRAVICDEERIYPDETGVYRLPASRGRIQIAASVMDYSMLDPTVRLYLDDAVNDGITCPKSELSALEYTDLPYGNYILHLQIVDGSSGEVLQEDNYRIVKAARPMELPLVRFAITALAALAAGALVWVILRGTIISRQYKEIYLAKEEAERANAVRSRFLSNMSHEILTPINTIVGMNEMTLREDSADVPAAYRTSIRDYALDIRAASETLKYMIDDLLDISDIQQGRAHISSQEYDTHELLKDLLSPIKARCDEKGIDLRFDIDEMLPARLEGDTGKIKQILLNLLTNSVKYTSKGSITFSLSMEERQDDECTLRFTVKDTGGGISEKNMQTLFSLYDRIGDLDSDEEMGTGIGLEISHRFAELMNGSIDCESKEGEGTTFVFTIAQKIIDHTPIGSFAQHGGMIAANTYIPLFKAPDAEVLLISGDQMTIKVVKCLLKATEVFVTTSSNINECADIIRDSKIAVALYDTAVMTAESDDTVKLRRYDESLPIYAITSGTSAETERYKETGFDGAIPKPIDGRLLEKTVEQCLIEDVMERQDLYTRR